MDWCRAVSKSTEKWRVSCRVSCKAVSSLKEEARQNSKSWRALRCRGDWIRTSDLLNPIQAPTQPNLLPQKDSAASRLSACTSACTSEAKTEHADPLAELAAVLLNLPPADRARLAAMLADQQGGTASRGLGKKDPAECFRDDVRAMLGH